MDMEFTSGRMVIDTKENGNFVSSKAKALICLLMAMCTLGSTQRVNHTDSDSINGRTLRYTLVSLKME
jgi:hypothetical protein